MKPILPILLITTSLALAQTVPDTNSVTGISPWLPNGQAADTNKVTLLAMPTYKVTGYTIYPMQGSNFVSGQNYAVLAETNAAKPLSNWATVSYVFPSNSVEDFHVALSIDYTNLFFALRRF